MAVSTQTHPRQQTGSAPDFRAFAEAHGSEPIVIILGCQGSGTNLLSKLLMKVFDFSVIRDRSLIYNAAVNVMRSPGGDTVEREDRRIRRALFPSPFRRRFAYGHYHHRNRGYVGIDTNIAGMAVESPRDFAYRYYLHHAWKEKASHVALKCDDMWENVAHLETVFPDAKLIQLVRDPRDNALSIMRKNFGPRDIYSASRYVKMRINRYDEAIRAFPGNALQITYESVLNDPHEFISQFRDTFGFPTVKDVAGAVEALQIRPHNKQKWRRIPAADLRVSETVLQAELHQFGYEIATPDIGALSGTTVARHVLNDTLLRVPQKLAYVTDQFRRG